MLLRLRHAVVMWVQLNDQDKARVAAERETNDAQAAGFEQPCQGGGTGGDAVEDINLIIRHQFKPARQKPKHEIGFAGPWRPDHQNRVTIS